MSCSIGGAEAIPGSWPWAGQLGRSWDGYVDYPCGATIVNSNWVVTAAHCFMYVFFYR